MILKAKSIEVELNKKTSSGPEEFIHMAKSLPLVDLEVKNTAFIFLGHPNNYIAVQYLLRRDIFLCEVFLSVGTFECIVIQIPITSQKFRFHE